MLSNGIQEGSRVAIIDDEDIAREVLKAFYEGRGYEVVQYSCPKIALEALTAQLAAEGPAVDLIVCDLKMPEMDGIEFMGRLFETGHRIPVILVSAHGSVEIAVEGLAKGAHDYVTKPVNFTELAVISTRAIALRRLEKSYRSLERKVASAWALEDILGKSPQMQRVFECVRRISPSSCNVLITGESGTGKDMVARAIHARSQRAAKPFVALNCTAIPESLLESELFGHSRGAFTGATERRRGLLEEAHEGTIFFDEIGDMPLPLQAKLLRFLQDRKIKPVGDNTYRTVDVRVIAATHCKLKEAVKNKSFREDLYYRLCVVPIEIAPLRHRKEDILLLAEHFLKSYTRKNGSSVVGFTRAAMAKLARLPWNGNVRELENTIERSMIFCRGTMIDEQDIQVTDLSEPDAAATKLFSSLKPLEEIEREYIEYVLIQTGNRQEKAAELLGINRKTLYRKQKEFGISSRHQQKELRPPTELVV